MIASLNFGDVPTWVGAITTGLGLITALILFRRQSDALSKTVEELRRTRFTPAAGVCIWKAREGDRSKLVVWNTTQFPITDVAVRIGDGPASRALDEFSTMFPPGQKEEADLADAMDAALPAMVTFCDAFGSRWQRTPTSVRAIGTDSKKRRALKP